MTLRIVFSFSHEIEINGNILLGSELAISKADRRSCAVANNFIHPVNHNEAQGCSLSELSHYYSRYAATWVDAKLECEAIGGYLSKADDYFELQRMTKGRSTWIPASGHLWVGLKDHDGGNTDYRWRDGTALTDVSMWNPGQPDHAAHHCGFLPNDVNFLEDTACTERFSFICEVDQESEFASSRADIRSCYVANDLFRPVRDAETYDEVVCPRNKIYFSPSHWKNFMTWSEADAYCKAGNGNLAKITTLDEQLMVDRFREVRGLANNYWIGGTDVSSEGNYTWADGQLINGDGGWPGFITSSEPASDTSKNCVATGGTTEWYLHDCATKYPILCDVDVDLAPNQQSCYWILGNDQWTNHRDRCASAGGNLANIKNVRHFERMVKVVGSLRVHIGLHDEFRNWDMRGTDGSLSTWSKWAGNTEPNQLHEQYTVYYSSTKSYNDITNSGGINGLCEKQVFQFRDADILHTDNGITVSCHEYCSFHDGNTTKTWTCADIDVTSEAEGCLCPVENWAILEPWLGHLNTSAIQDNDNDTCITPGSTRQVMTLSSNRTYHGSIEAEVILSPDNVRSSVRVFTSTDLSSPAATCQLSGPLSRCKHVAGPRFACTCSSPCHVYVKVFLAEGSMLPLTLCEIRVI